MLEVEHAADLKAYEGKEIGVSDWYTVTQEQIDKFADATGDHQWIHVDVERCKKEMPGGKTIAHGWPRRSTGSNTARAGSTTAPTGCALPGRCRQGRAFASGSSSRKSRKSRAGCASPTKAPWNSKARPGRCWSPRRSGWSTIEERSHARYPQDRHDPRRHLFRARP